jgi:cytochrome c biogenesis protein CcdA
MIDPLSIALESPASHSASAFGLLFIAGASTSVGPCIAPRYIAVAAIAGTARRPGVAIFTFAAGLIGAYVALGFAAGFLGGLWSWSGPIDLALSAGLIAGGTIALVRAKPHDHSDAHGGHACAAPRRADDGAPRSLGAIFLLGALSAFVLSPCCTPIVAVIAGASTATGKPLEGALLLAAFACGHALPLAFAGRAGALLARLVPRAATQAPAIVGAVLMLALGAYYGLLA